MSGERPGSNVHHDDSSSELNSSDLRSPGEALKVISMAGTVLAKMQYAPWLKVHGKLKRPEMSKKQQLELKECFELIDSGGSGAIPTTEVQLAFSVLGMDVKKAEIEEVIADVDPESTGVIHYPQFMSMMLAKLERLPHDAYAPRDDGKDPSTQYSLPFSLLAQAYRRKKLIEAVMGGDKPLQDRMNYRSTQVDAERRDLRDEALGKPKQVPRKNWPMTLSQSQRAKQAARAAKLKTKKNTDKPAARVHVPGYLIETMDADVKEVLLSNQKKSSKKSGSVPKLKSASADEKAGDINRPWSVDKAGPSTNSLKPMKISFGQPAVETDESYKQEKLAAFRTVVRHKPTFKQQVIHVQAFKTLRDFHKHGLWEVKGSPFVYPASRRPSFK